MVAPIVAAAGKVALRMLASKASSDPNFRKKVVAVAGCAVVLPPVLGFGVIFVATSSITNATTVAAAEAESACAEAPVGSPTGVALTVDQLTADQTGIASTIVAVTKSATPLLTDEATRQRAAVVAVAAALQESHLTNLAGGDRDSLGVFQQRPSAGWGTPEQVQDPVYATSAFLEGVGSTPGLLRVKDWPTVPLTQAAQAVQRSAFPDAYAQWEQLASSVVSQLWSTVAPIPVSPALVRDAAETVSTTVSGTDDASTCPDSGTTAPGNPPGPWGGYANGVIPESVLCQISFAPVGSTMLMRCDAERHLEALNNAFKADHDGTSLQVSSAYRPLALQGGLHNLNSDTAAPAGASNHGWALAVDLQPTGQLGDFSNPNYGWLQAHAAAFGFVHPAYMEPGGSGPLEPWHWEWWPNPTGTDTSTPTPAATP